jgi:beta-glucanase (GH16 family)
MLQLLFLLPYIAAQTSVITSGNVTGNCLTGALSFDPLRMYAINQNAKAPTLDISKYDFTIDYGSANVKQAPGGGVYLNIARDLGATTGTGTRISTTRYALYGKFSVTMNASPIGGIVTTFITMSGRHDEIDWEFIGSQNNQVQSNFFYKGIKEFVVHGGTHKLPINGSIDGEHVYEIDWKSTGLTFSIDGVVVRTVLNNANATSPLTPKGERWYPSTPSQIQMSVWDGCVGGLGGTCTWANGPIQWGGRTSYNATFRKVNIQCYDDKDLPVAKWPLTNNPDYAAADPEQSTGETDSSGAKVPDSAGLRALSSFILVTIAALIVI